MPDAIVRACLSTADEVGRQISHEPLALFVTSSPQAVSATADLLRRSVRRALADPVTCAEVAAWFRPSREIARRLGDGEALDAAGYGRWELLVARKALGASWRPLLMKLGGAERAARHAAAHTGRSSLLMVWASLPRVASPWEDDALAERYFVRAGCAIEASWLTLTTVGGGMQIMTPCVIFPESRRELAEILQLPPGYEPLSLQRAGYPLERSLETPARRPLSKLVGCL